MTKAKPRSGRRKFGRGAIMVLVGLFLVSATLRFGIGVQQVLAANPEPESSTEPEPDHHISQPSEGSGASRAELALLLEKLSRREAKIEERERKLAMRTQALDLADAEITKRLGQLQEAEASLRQTLSLADGAAENDLARLTSVYENMKPKDAAALFEQMDPGFASGFLGRMRPDAAASILAGLSPEVAYTVSVILAGRNAAVPKN